MATLSLSAVDSALVKADALIVVVASTDQGPRVLGAGLPGPLLAAVRAAAGPLGVTGAADTVQRFATAGVVPASGTVKAPVLVLTGAGPVTGRRGQPSVSAEALRRAVGAAARSLTGVASVAVLPPDTDSETDPDSHLDALAAVCEGALLGAYAFTRYRHSSAAAGKDAVRNVVVLTAQARRAPARAVARRAQALADAVTATRDLINMPPSDLFPAAFADTARDVVADLPVRITVLDERRLARGGYGGLLGVGMGSSRPPRLVRLDYAPTVPGEVPYVALIGKGITFDSGGLSIKTAAGMETMKSDMSGAAAVLHTVVAVARLGLPVRVSGWLALAENMPSGTAQRPSDVLTIRGGTTVEVLNTDAEGRLVLADALVAAGETGPDLMIDVATLTGAQMVALGNRVSAIMANDDDLRARVHRVADAVGEQFWPMPLPPELRSSMDSPVADIANMGDRYGGMLVAGLFLAEFVGTRPSGEKIPWTHLDIAGPSFNTGSPYGYTPAGGTGVAVRTLLGLVEDVAEHGA